MRITDLRALISESFADPDTYSKDIVHSELGGATVNQALDIGFEPREIWKAIVAHNPERFKK
jgi:hypothetical protein